MFVFRQPVQFGIQFQDGTRPTFVKLYYENLYLVSLYLIIKEQRAGLQQSINKALQWGVDCLPPPSYIQFKLKALEYFNYR